MRLLPKRTCWGLMVAALTILIGSMLASCDDLATRDDGAVTTGGAGDTSSTEALVSSTDTLAPTTTVPPTPTTEPLSTSSEERLPSGHIKACGIIDDVWMDGGVRKLKIDYVDFLTGAEADAAAIADGFISPGEHVDNDYYVRNNNPRLRTFFVSNTVEIYTEYRNLLVEVQPCSWTDFLSFWGPGPLPEGDAHMPDSLWWIERDGDTVVWIRQQFVP